MFKNDIRADPAEPFRLHVWAEYALGRIMGTSYVEKVINKRKISSSPLKSKKLSQELSWAVEYALKMIRENKAPPVDALKSVLETPSHQSLLNKYKTISKEEFYHEFAGDLAGHKELLMYLLFYKEILEFYQILITDLKKENYPRESPDYK